MLLSTLLTTMRLFYAHKNGSLNPDSWIRRKENVIYNIAHEYV